MSDFQPPDPPPQPDEDERSCDEKGQTMPDKYCRMGQCEIFETSCGAKRPCKCWEAFVSPPSGRTEP